MALLSLFLQNGVIILISLFLLPLSGFWPFSFKPPRAALGGVITAAPISVKCPNNIVMAGRSKIQRKISNYNIYFGCCGEDISPK